MKSRLFYPGTCFFVLGSALLFYSWYGSVGLGCLVQDNGRLLCEGLSFRWLVQNDLTGFLVSMAAIVTGAVFMTFSQRLSSKITLLLGLATLESGLILSYYIPATYVAKSVGEIPHPYLPLGLALIVLSSGLLVYLRTAGMPKERTVQQGSSS